MGSMGMGGPMQPVGGMGMGMPGAMPGAMPMNMMGNMGMPAMGMNPMMMMNPMMGMMMNPMSSFPQEVTPKEGLVESAPKDKRKGRSKGKLAPNAEHCQMPIDPQVEALCKTFDIEDRIMRRLNDVMLTREATFDTDMKALWEVCENAKKPSGFLMVKIGELERGCFTGAGKLDQAMLQFRNRWRLDDRALAKFVEVVHPREEKTEVGDRHEAIAVALDDLTGTLMLDQFQATGKSDLNMQKAVPDQFWGCQDMAQLDKLLKGVANPSQGILPMLNHLRAMGSLEELIREKSSEKRRDSRTERELRYCSKSRSRSRSRRRR
ncbi:unnamed protein product [Effrenium voratum]|nr:unnamed protein product [Effrenium voratum]